VDYKEILSWVISNEVCAALKGTSGWKEALVACGKAVAKVVAAVVVAYIIVCIKRCASN
jgi:uncharacterized membrane protein